MGEERNSEEAGRCRARKKGRREREGEGGGRWRSGKGDRGKIGRAHV